MKSSSFLFPVSNAAALGWLAIFAQGFHPSKISRRFPYPFHAPCPRQQAKLSGEDDERGSIVLSRRTTVVASIATAASLASFPSKASSASRRPNGLALSTAPNSGLRWADARVGTGEALSAGGIASIDYSMASTAGRFPSIYSTQNGDAPYRWRLGDGSTIRGVELAVLGDPSEGIPPMRPGGIRRVIIPNSLGFNALIGRDDANNVLTKDDVRNLSPTAKNPRCLAGNEGSLGPIPPREAPDGAYNRWFQFYCNSRIPYQPDLVLDIKLYGKRGTSVAAIPQQQAQ